MLVERERPEIIPLAELHSEIELLTSSAMRCILCAHARNVLLTSYPPTSSLYSGFWGVLGFVVWFSNPTCYLVLMTLKEEDPIFIVLDQIGAFSDLLYTVLQKFPTLKHSNFPLPIHPPTYPLRQESA